MNAHQPYILARTMKDAHAFARGPLGLVHGKYRVVTHASTIKSVRKANLYLVPGFEKRYDRFAINGALRWTRMNLIRYPEGMSVRDLEVAYRYNRIRNNTRDEALEAFRVSELVGKPDGLNPPGEQLVLDRTAIFQEMSDELEDEPVVSSNEDNEPVSSNEDKPKNRRRRRCNDCGTLHYKTDPCPGDPFPVD